MNETDVRESRTFEEQEAFVRDALGRAEGLRRKKEYKEGISLLVEALKYGMQKDTIYYRLGNIYIDGGDLARAEYAYKRALEVNEHHTNAMHNLAIVYKRQNKISLYVKTYKKSQRLAIRRPRNVDLSADQKRRVRRMAWKTFAWLAGGCGLVVLLIYLFGR